MLTNSIQTYARLGGLLFLVSLVAGGFGEAYAPSQIIVSGDAGMTAHQVLSSNMLFRAGFAAYTIEALCDVALAGVFFVLMRAANGGVAILFVLFHLMATATFAFAEVFYFAPAFILSNDSYTRSFAVEQLNALALLSLNIYGFAGTFSQVFYGVASILLGYLIYRSDYLPRVIGAIWILSGVAFVFSVYAEVMVPAYNSSALAAPTFLALVVTMLWLLIRGVDVAKWESRSRSSVLVPAG